MYGIFTWIWLNLVVNVWKYTSPMGGKGKDPKFPTIRIQAVDWSKRSIKEFAWGWPENSTHLHLFRWSAWLVE